MRSCLTACRNASLKVRWSTCLLLTKKGRSRFPEQSPRLLKNELEFLDGGCLEDVVEGMANLEFLKLRKGFLQGMDASDEGVRVDGYGCNP